MKMTFQTVKELSQISHPNTASDSPYTNLDLVIPKVLGQVRKQKSIWGRRGIAVGKRKAKKPEPIIEDTRE